MFTGLFGLNAQRERALKKAKDPIMREFLATPFPEKHDAWQESELVSLDLETSGLNTSADHILSYGMVNISDSAIHMNTTRHEIITTDRELTEPNVIIHRITDDINSEGIAIRPAMEEILGRLAGKIMLVHFKRIEQQFIDKACRRLFNSPFIIPTIDTMQLAERLLIQKNHTTITNELRLFNLLQKYELPPYQAHNALYDAISTAELFLALAARIHPEERSPLRHFLC